MPDGNYVHWPSQSLMAGGNTRTVDAPLEELPLFLRANHLIPMLDPTIDTLAAEDHPEVVGPGDVADVYDVVGLLEGPGTAEFTLWTGSTFSARRTTAEDSPGLVAVNDASEWATCNGCFWVEDLENGLRRLHISSAESTVTVAGIQLTNDTGRRLRWDLYLSPQ
jgi:hypothetical protein